MRVTIIKNDNQVSVDGHAISGLDLSFMDPAVRAVQWYGTHGEVEFYALDGVQPVNTHISDYSEFAPAIAAWQAAYAIETAPPPELTPEEKLLAQQAQAKQLLANSDWAVLPDVGLVNQDEWLSYRTALRVLATTQTELVTSFPTQPQVIWA